MQSWFPLHSHSVGSITDSPAKPDAIAARLVQCGHPGTAITDHAVISEVPALIKAFSKTCKCSHNERSHAENGKGKCQKKGCECTCFDKASLKLIAGCEFNVNVPGEDGGYYHLCVLAKNQEGWRGLVRATSESNKPEYFYRRPRLPLEKLASFSEGNFIVFSGHMGSELANVIFGENTREAFRAKSYEEARKFVRADWKEAVDTAIQKHQKLFGEANFYVEIQLIDKENLPVSLVVARILRNRAKALSVPRIATADSHYPTREDARDQRVQLCSLLDKTLAQVGQQVDNDEDFTLGGFFRSSMYYIPSCEEMNELHADEQEELSNTLKIAELCSTPSISRPPMIPTFPTPDGSSNVDFLRKLVKEGWEKKIVGTIPPTSFPAYQERLDMEMKVFTEDFPILSSYALVVWDYINYARNVLKRLVGKGRGSSAGSLIMYLLDITRIDPVARKLLFSRFYNAGRNAPGKVSLPDVDTDFPAGARDQVFQYLQEKYGHDKVCQMCTFQRMQGRSALSEVLRVHGFSFDEIKRITEFIPDESKISDQLQETMEETGEASIIRWAFENNGEKLKEWAWINEEDEFEGPLAPLVCQAIRLEGVKKATSKHASGVLITSEPLDGLFPMIRDKSNEANMLCGWDMRDSEEAGGTKFDLLGLSALNRVEDTVYVIRNGQLPA